MKRKHCWGPHPDQHIPECRPGRPLCRWRRKAYKNGLCYCEAYHFPHRHGGGDCLYGKHGAERFYEMLNRPMRGGLALCG